LRMARHHMKDIEQRCSPEKRERKWDQRRVNWMSFDVSAASHIKSGMRNAKEDSV